MPSTAVEAVVNPPPYTPTGIARPATQRAQHRCCCRNRTAQKNYNERCLNRSVTKKRPPGTRVRRRRSRQTPTWYGFRKSLSRLCFFEKIRPSRGRQTYICLELLRKACINIMYFTRNPVYGSTPHYPTTTTTIRIPVIYV